ncbi:MAG: glycosyltransferase family 9 protein [Verrucomicrobiota bacterium]
MLQLNRIGELVLTTPALKAIRDTWPEAHVTLVLNELCEGLIPALPKADDTLLYKRKIRFNRALFGHLLTGRFDACLDFTGTDRSALLALASRAKKRVAFSSARKGPVRSLIYQHFVQVSTDPAHALDRVYQLVRPLGVPPPQSPPHPILLVPRIASNRIVRLLTECGVPGDFALIQPGGSIQERYWLPERWAELILALQHKHGLPCVLTGGPEAFEQEHLRSIQTALAVLSTTPLPFPLVTLAGQLDLMLLTALIERARIVASCDSSVSHMAAAFRRPQITLYGPSNPFHSHPRHTNASVLFAGAPEDVTTIFNAETPLAPMSLITTQSALLACEHLLKATSPTSPQSSSCPPPL